MFTSFNDKLLYSASTAAYNSALEDLMVFASTNERKHLKFWVEWWHTRRYHIFRAWCPKGAPSTNLAEIGYSRWSKQGFRKPRPCNCCQRRCCRKYFAATSCPAVPERHLLWGKWTVIDTAKGKVLPRSSESSS